jgi:iron complex outermembrane receptor protein
MTAPADSTMGEQEPIELDPIVVVGRREPTRLSKTVNSVLKISPQKVETAAEDNILHHLAYSHASISVTSVSGTGFGLGPRGQGKLLIRGLGFSPNRGSLVVIDGRPDIAGLFGHPLPDTYRRAGLYSAELVKGGTSTLYGSNAIAGVLNLQSFHRPDLDRYTGVEITGGNHHTFNGVARHSQRFGRTTVAGWYEYIESDNHRKDNEYFNRSGGVRVQLDRIAGFEMFLAGRYTSFDFADAGPVYDPSRSTGDIQRSGITFGMDREANRLLMSVRLYNSYGEHTFSDGFESIDRNNGLDIFAKVKRAGYRGLSLSGGVSFNYLGGSAGDGTLFVRSGTFSEKEYAVHGQVELDVKDKFDITLGGRYIDHDRYGHHFVYQAGAVVPTENYGSLKLSVGTAYRNPTINESQLFVISNAETLKPEDGTFYEIGYFNQLGSSLSMEAAIFFREGDNLITALPNPSPPPLAKFQNSGSYSHSGWEAALRYVRGVLGISSSFLHLNQDDHNLSVPENKLAVAGEYASGPMRIGLEAIAAFNTTSDSAGTTVVLDDYVVVNFDQRYAISEQVDLKLRFENLFDRDYQVVHGYPMPGITFRTGLVIRIN